MCHMCGPVSYIQKDLRQLCVTCMSSRSCVGRRRLCQPLGTAYLVLTIVTMLGFYSITLDYARLQALRQQTGVLDTPEVAKGSPPPALAPEKAVPSKQ